MPEIILPEEEKKVEAKQPRILFSVLELPEGGIDIKVEAKEFDDSLQLEALLAQLLRGVNFDNVVKLVEQRFEERAKLMMAAREKQKAAALEAQKISNKL